VVVDDHLETGKAAVMVCTDQRAKVAVSVRIQSLPLPTSLVEVLRLGAVDAKIITLIGVAAYMRAACLSSAQTCGCIACRDSAAGDLRHTLYSRRRTCALKNKNG
jgi:hypothetical protein